MDVRSLERILRRATIDGRPGTLDVVYHKKTTGGLVIRRVRPYEIAHDGHGTVLWATDTIHGATRIHKFRVPRILEAEPSGHTYRTKWPVKTPGVDPDQRFHESQAVSQEP